MILISGCDGWQLTEIDNNFYFNHTQHYVWRIDHVTRTIEFTESDQSFWKKFFNT